MATARPLSEIPQKWGTNAIALAEQAKVLSGAKIAQLVRKLQRQTGYTSEECWRFVIQYGMKADLDNRRCWNDAELEVARELITKYSVEEVAKKLNRTPKSLYSALQRRQLLVREIRCDCFSVVSLARALHVRTAEVRFWIEKGWLEASVEDRKGRGKYRITPEAIAALYKNHVHDLQKRIPKQSLFEAYVQYCFAPKHTVGEQLLDVRRDKRERAAYAALQSGGMDSDGSEEEDDDALDA
jgi:hypothetical protein